MYKFQTNFLIWNLKGSINKPFRVGRAYTKFVDDGNSTEFKSFPPNWRFNSLLEVERIDYKLYKTKNVNALWNPPASRALYGGQVIGQALLAGYYALNEEVPDLKKSRGKVEDINLRKTCHESMDSTYQVHSMHAYFLRPGTANVPLIFKVKPMLLGNTLRVFNITAIQNGSPILTLQASFSKKEDSAFNYVKPPPPAPHPETLTSNHSFLLEMQDDPDVPEKFRKFLKTALKDKFPLDFREVTDEDPKEVLIRSLTSDLSGLNGILRPAKRLFWIKAVGEVEKSHTHRCIAAWASDWGLGVNPLAALGLNIFSPQLSMCCSIDHAMYFHEDFKVDDWLLYELDTNWAGNGRGVTNGRIYDLNGQLKISTCQEAIIRFKKGLEFPTDGPFQR